MYLLFFCIWPMTGAVKFLWNKARCVTWQGNDLSWVWTQTLCCSTLALMFCICGGLKVPKNICLPPSWHCPSPAQTSLHHAVLPACHICLRMASVGDIMGSFQLDRSHKHLAWKQIVGPPFDHYRAFSVPEQSRFKYTAGAKESEEKPRQKEEIIQISKSHHVMQSTDVNHKERL